MTDKTMETIDLSKLHKVGDLAKQAGKSVRALHLYEELGLLTPAARSQGGFRLYDETALRQIRWIELLQESGFTLHQIQGLLREWQTTHYGPKAMGVLREAFLARLTETREQLGRLRALEQELVETLHYLHTCDQCRPVRTTEDDCPHCPEDHGVKEEPALVAGFHIATRPQGGANGGGIPIPLGSKSR
ncbi:MAG: MerR family transcriptional regulator [Candidatus Eisenbacteria bacterium]